MTNNLPEMLTTNEAAAALRKQPQTLYKWSSTGSAPIHPVRVNGKLLWRADDVRKLLGA